MQTKRSRWWSYFIGGIVASIATLVLFSYWLVNRNCSPDAVNWCAMFVFITLSFFIPFGLVRVIVWFVNYSQKQKLLLFLMAVLVVWSGVFPSWYNNLVFRGSPVKQYLGRHVLWSPPDASICPEIDMTRLAIEWGLILIVGFLLYLIAGISRQRKNERISLDLQAATSSTQKPTSGSTEKVIGSSLCDTHGEDVRSNRLPCSSYRDNLEDEKVVSAPPSLPRHTQHSPSERQQVIGTWKSVTAIASIILLYIIYQSDKPLIQRLMKIVLRPIAMNAVEEECKAEKAPTGFQSATWLMSQTQVQSLFPAAFGVGDGDMLLLQTNVFDRPATVSLEFTNDSLVMVIITFSDKEENLEVYYQTHNLVEKEYGRFSSPTKTQKYTLFSEKVFNKVELQHILYPFEGIPEEQVLIFKTKKD